MDNVSGLTLLYGISMFHFVDNIVSVA